MGNTPKPIGKRINLIDPNEFEYQYAAGMFGDTNYNMSVPLEDLSIMVELKTQSKSRTVLNTKNNNNTAVNSDNSVVKVNFIGGSNDNTTGFQNNLTTSYTEVSTELGDDVEEALGITNIEIDFNSSYAPMVHIDFIDVRGGAIFQNNGQSKFNVFFRLPYPIFELTVKGYYGKPVKYCLHMLKCNTKFNSQTGNFEISADFVGYTYAMFADMLIGYIKAAARTKDGIEALKAKNVISIREFIEKISKIDQTASTQLLTTEDEDVKNLAQIEKLKDILTQMKDLVDNTSILLNGTPYTKYVVPNRIIDTANIAETIVVISNPDPTNTSFIMPDVYQIKDTYNKKINEMVVAYNKLIENLKDVQITTASDLHVKQFTNYTYYDVNEPSQDFIVGIKRIYNVVNDAEVNTYVDRFKTAVTSANGSKIGLAIYDLTDAINIIRLKLDAVNQKQEDLTKTVAQKLRELIAKELGFDSSIRNIVNIFTTHIEVFLELLFKVSASASDMNNTQRNAELEKFKKTNNTSTGVDVSKKAIRENIIYPWPEYFEENVEKYLGGRGVLANPLNVPEVKFVEELYEAMLREAQDDAKLNELNETGVTWLGTSPLDSFYYNKDEVNPYDRLNLDSNGNPTQEDVARLATLRAMTYMGFSNNLLTTDEITAFAEKEGDLIITKLKTPDNKLVKAFNLTYTTPENFAGVKGIINGESIPVLIEDAGKPANWFYNYIYRDASGSLVPSRSVMPIKGNFTNAKFEPKNESAATFKLSNVNSRKVIKDSVDGANYIDFIDDYGEKIPKLATPQQSSVFNFDSLNSTFTTSAQLKEAGFQTNSGTYGVQEFSKIMYGTDTLDFYSLFYNAGDGNGENRLVPSLCRKRGNYKTIWDISGNMNVPITEDDPYNYDLNKIYLGRENIGKNILLFQENDNNSEIVTYPFFGFGISEGSQEIQVSLFGSRFYNAQTLSGKTFLFLQSFPWRGLINESANNKKGFFKTAAISNIFEHRTGFIQVPYLFPAFIGALLWRLREGNKTADGKINENKVGADPIIFEVGGEPLLPSFTDSSIGNNIPETYEYMSLWYSSLSFSNDILTNYPDLDDELIYLPEAVKDKFITEFLNFTTEFSTTYQNIFELTANGATDDASWKTAWNNINASVTTTRIQGYKGLIGKVNFGVITSNVKQKNNKPLTESYNVFSLVSDKADDNEYKYNYILEYKDDSEQAKTLKRLFFSKRYIGNHSWMIWSENLKNSSASVTPISIDKNTFSTYIKALTNKIKGVVDVEEKKKFSTNESNEIKLEIYRTLKKIYDKWVASSDSSDDVLFQCCTAGVNKRLTGDVANSTHRGGSKLGIIDSFRFVSRSFKDIGDSFQINPLVIYKQLMDSTNINFYDFISRILTDNNFDFVALPSFVDYNDPKELVSVFTPYPYYEAKNLIAPSGPSFVCVYVGQTSTKLDFGDSSQYPNDGFDLTDSVTWPKDFSGVKNEWEDLNAAFVVRYGQQNQNIFKDISLDQKEFSETAESLQITDNIANSYSDMNKSYYGQNLYNVYSVRSYTAEIEMLGNAMIQPMMYFQLDNIPMFHGAYLITHVKHSIKPNTMSTVFTGVRIKANETPIIDGAALYSQLLSTFELPQAKEGVKLTYKLSENNPENRVNVKQYLKAFGLSKEVTAGIMGNIEVESNFRLGALNARDTNNVQSIGLIQWNLNSYREVFTAYNAGNFGTVTQQLDYLTQKMSVFNTFLKSTKTAPQDDEQYMAFLFAHYVEVCCGCANTRGYKTLPEIYGGPYTQGWGCPQNDPKAKKFFPHKRSQAASKFLLRFNDPKDKLYWDLTP